MALVAKLKKTLHILG